MFSYTLQYPNMATKFYTPRYISPAAKMVNMPVLVPVTMLGREDFGKENIPPVVTAIWQSLKMQAVTKQWKSLVDFYLYLVGKRADTASVWCISDILEDLEIATLFSFKKWQEVRTALSEGHPVIVGGSAYQNFIEAEHTGLVPLPTPGDKILGGFVTTLFSYDGEVDLIKGLSTINYNFGKEGTLLFRGSYLRNLLVCRDFFTLIPRIN